MSLVAGFVVANRAAYKGYFSADEFDNLAWSYYTPWTEFGSWFLSPQFHPSNFRPVGHAFFKLASRTDQWNFAGQLAAVQLLHGINVLLVWRLLAGLFRNPEHWAARAGATAVFAFHGATLAAYWKPMYVFDVLATMFTLLALLAWMWPGGRWRSWVLATMSFWCAYKAKEWAVAIPFVLLAYEWLVGRRRWKELLPMIGLAVSFGVQALAFKPNGSTPYELRLTPWTMAETANFYLAALLGLGVAGGLAASVALGYGVWKGGSVGRWGVMMFGLLLGPMLLVPGRVAPVYLYASMVGVAVFVAAVFARAGAGGRSWAIWLVLPWLAWQYQQLREFRRVELQEAGQRRQFVSTLRGLQAAGPKPVELRFESFPRSMENWGTQGVITMIWREDRPRVELPVNSYARLAELPKAGVGTVWLRWDETANGLFVDPILPVGSKLVLQPGVTSRRLGSGWLDHEGGQNGYRWVTREGFVELLFPKDATTFELGVNLGENLRPKVEVAVRANGRNVCTMSFLGDGLQESSCRLPASIVGELAGKKVMVSLAAEPVILPTTPNGEALSVAVRWIGFGR